MSFLRGIFSLLVNVSTVSDSDRDYHKLFRSHVTDDTMGPARNLPHPKKTPLQRRGELLRSGMDGSFFMQERLDPVSGLVIQLSQLLLPPLPLIHQPPEIPKQIVRIVRAGARLRVVLHAQQRHRAVAQTFERLIV